MLVVYHPTLKSQKSEENSQNSEELLKLTSKQDMPL